MKHPGIVFISLFLLSFAGWSQQNWQIPSEEELLERKEICFTLQLDKQADLSRLGRLLSIEKYGNETGLVFAYASRENYQKFLKMGMEHSISVPPSLSAPAKMYEGGRTSYDWDAYPTYESYIAMMESFAADYPELCELYEIGESVEGRKILAVKLHSLNYGGKRPDFLYTGQMHGDELVCYILQLRLIDYLLSNYGSNERVTKLLSELVIWINPLANPDGTYAAGNETVNGATRMNANGVDLNRNFPDPVYGAHPDGNDWQVETVHFMELAQEVQFAFSANTHSGAEVVNYPWDHKNEYTADKDWWINISRSYADAARTNSPSGYFDGFDNGITHGYSWYPTHGSRQDYMNYFASCRESTIEQSNAKFVPAAQLTDYWEYNRDALLQYMESGLTGFRGTVRDSITNQALHAKIFISNHDKDSSWVFSNETDGWYFRPVLPGTYSVKCSAAGYLSKYKTIEVSEGSYIWEDFSLKSSGTAIDETTQKPFSISCEHKKLYLNYPQEAEISIFDIQGRPLLSRYHSGGEIYINLSDTAPGIYLISIEDDTKKFTEKFFLE